VPTADLTGISRRDACSWHDIEAPWRGLAGMRRSPIDAMHTRLGVAAGIPRGELAGASANWLALVKMLTPQLFRVLSERAVRTGKSPGTPFFVAAATATVGQLLLTTIDSNHNEGGREIDR
jgi:hypothetical protein